MPLMKEKRFSLGGFQVMVSTDAQRVERMRANPLYRYIIRPGLHLVSGTANGNGRHSSEDPFTVVTPSTRPASFADPQAQAIWDRVSSIGWYHTIDLGRGIVTPGFIDNRETVNSFGIPEDLTGKRCLDIGTYDGFWAFEFERRGASEVIAIDVDSPADYDIPRRDKQQAIEESEKEKALLREKWTSGASRVGLQFPGDGFRLAREVLKSKVERRVLNVYDLSPDKVGMFDVVLISQLLLRLRDPQTVLENMFSVTRGCAIVGEPYDAELEGFDRPVSEYIGTTALGAWWGHSVKSMKRMMQVAGFDPVEEVMRFPVENRVGHFSKVILKGHTPSVRAAD